MDLPSNILVPPLLAQRYKASLRQIVAFGLLEKVLCPPLVIRRHPVTSGTTRTCGQVIATKQSTTRTRCVI
eukprot:1843487-Alexandrium_andersonii.AAC.1